MCRDGFFAPCVMPKCEGVVTCRDHPRLCADCWDETFEVDD